MASTTTSSSTPLAPHCHVGAGWDEYSTCVGQCAAAGYQSRSRFYSSFSLDAGSCGDVVCAVAIVEDGTSCEAPLGSLTCDEDGVKFGIAFSAASAEDAEAQVVPIMVAMASSVQVRFVLACARTHTTLNPQSTEHMPDHDALRARKPQSTHRCTCARLRTCVKCPTNNNNNIIIINNNNNNTNTTTTTTTWRFVTLPPGVSGNQLRREFRN